MIKKLSFLILTFLLASCRNDDAGLNYNSLMRNPDVLKHEIQDCQNGEDTAEFCVIVMRAAADMNAIIEEQQSDPEKFGQQIIDIEEAYGKAKILLAQQKDNLAALKKNNAPANDVQAAQEKVNAAQKDVDEKKNKIRILLAVMGLSTPE